MRFCPAASAPPLLALILALLFLVPHSAMSTPQLVGAASGVDTLLWNDGNGVADLWVIGSGPYTHHTYGPYAGWTPVALAAGQNAVPRILWTNTDGRMSLWSVDGGGGFTHADYGPYTGYTAVGLAVGGDNAPRVLWAKTDGTMSLWRVAPDTTFTHAEYGPFPGYTASLIAAGIDSIPRILWTKSDGSISLWRDVTSTADFAHAEYGPYSGYTAMSMSVDVNGAPRILWNHPTDSTTSLWSVASGGGFTYQNYNNPAGSSPVVVSSSPTSPGPYEQLLYGQPDGTAVINYLAPDGSSLGMKSLASPAGTGGGGGGTGGGTTATPNPHGHYNVTYSGGTLASTDGATCQAQNVPTISGPTTTTDSNSVSTYSGSAQFSGFYGTTTTASAKLGGSNASPTPIIATFTWAPDSAGSPPPAYVTVVQICTVSWSAQYYINRTSGQCSTGLGQVSGTASGVPGNTVSGITTVSGGGPTFTVKCSPTAEVDAAGVGPNGTGTESLQTGTVSFSYTASAVVMNVSGTTPDPKGGDDLLTGQQCSASLRGVPSALAYPTTYNWSVTTSASVPAGGTAGSADVFKTYNDQAAANPLVLLSSADLAASSLSFYDKKQETIFIHCNAAVSTPDGKNSLFAFVLSQPISVLKPSVTAWGITGGIVRVNNSAGTFGFLGLPGDHTFVDGQSWHDVSLKVPAPFAGGQFCFAQLITPDVKYYRTLLAGSTASSFYQTKNNGIKGLDSGFPYLHQWTLPNQPVNVSLDVDSPQALIPGLTSTIPVNDTGGSRWNQVVATENFTTWLMYMPATTGAVWIPLQSYSWNWSGTEQDTDTNPDDPPSWSFMAGTPSSRLTYTGVNTDTPPTWTIIHSNSDPIGPP